MGPFDYPRVGPESPHVRLHWDPKIDGSTGQDRQKGAARMDINGNVMKKEKERRKTRKESKGKKRCGTEQKGKVMNGTQQKGQAIGRKE